VRMQFSPIRRSTRALFREGLREPGYSLLDFVHGYVYGRWPYAYIGLATGERHLPGWIRSIALRLARAGSNRANGSANRSPAQGFADRYHGKVVPPGEAEQLVTLHVEIECRDLERIVPYPLARDIVLRNPDHIVALECPCRAERPNPCLPLDVCLIVGEPFAGFVAEHHPSRARFITQQEAVDILHAEHARGHVHHAFFKDAMLGRFYAICNCCPCCCGAMQAWRSGTPMLASSGYVARHDSDACTGCGSCVRACPFDAIHAVSGAIVIDEEVCMGCGVCTSRCPHDAITLARDASKGEPLDLRELTKPVK
jgi:ferredoxin